MFEITIVLISIILMIILCLSGKLSSTASMLFAAIIMVLFGVITFDEAFGDLGSNTTITFIGFNILSMALVENGILSKMCEIITKTTKNENGLILSLFIFSFFMAIFISNKITIMFFVTILYELINKNKLNIKLKTAIFLLLSTSIGGLTMIPTTGILLTANNVISNQGLTAFKPFQLLPFGIIYFLILICYYFLFGKKIVNKIEDSKKINLELNDYKEKKYNLKKQIAVLIILLLCMTLFIFSDIKTGIIVLTAALICIMFDLVDEKTAFKKINWSIVLLFAASGAISSGLVNSGLSDILAGGILKVVTSSSSKIIVVAAIAGIIMLTTNFITMTASVSIYIPIGISIAKTLGFDPVIFITLIVLSVYMTFITPINSRNALILDAANIKVTDLIKINGPFMLIIYVTNVLIFSILL